MGSQSLSPSKLGPSMKSLLAISLVGGLCSTQFVFFGNNRQPQQPQRLTSQQSQSQNQRFESRPAVREGRILVEDESREEIPEREFAKIFFRPDRKIIHPDKKNSLPEEKMEKVKLVEILSEVPRTKIKEGSASEALVKQLSQEMSDNDNGINVITTTTSNGGKVTTPVPVTTTATTVTLSDTVTPTIHVTTGNPVTKRSSRGTNPPITTTANSILPAERKAPTATRILGTPRIVQLGSGRPISITNRFNTSSTSTPSSVAKRVPATQRTPKSLSSGESLKGNYEWEGKRYLLTWRTGRNNFDWSSGKRHCEGKGMKLISLDTKERADHFLSLVGRERAPYFWSGGQVSRDSRSLTWLNGVKEPVRKGQHPWSFTGRRGPQPDGGEICLAILNNVYRDGVKFHDVACHHRKPVVCEDE